MLFSDVCNAFISNVLHWNISVVFFIGGLITNGFVTSTGLDAPRP
jgi:hypothetical protein